MKDWHYFQSMKGLAFQGDTNISLSQAFPTSLCDSQVCKVFHEFMDSTHLQSLWGEKKIERHLRQPSFQKRNKSSSFSSFLNTKSAQNPTPMHCSQPFTTTGSMIPWSKHTKPIFGFLSKFAAWCVLTIRTQADSPGLKQFCSSGANELFGEKDQVAVRLQKLFFRCWDDHKQSNQKSRQTGWFMKITRFLSWQKSVFMTVCHQRTCVKVTIGIINWRRKLISSNFLTPDVKLRFHETRNFSQIEF